MSIQLKRKCAALLCGIMCLTSINIPAFAEPAEVDLTQNVEMTDETSVTDDESIDVTSTQSYTDITQDTSVSEEIQDTSVSEETQDIPMSETIDETAPDVDITSNVTPNVDVDITQTSDMGRYVKERTVTATCNGITVYVKGMLPYKTSLSVRPVNRYKQANYEAVIDGQDAEITREVITVLDIKLINEYGEEFEPDNTMQVTFAGGDVEDGVADSEKEIEVYHVVDDSINYTGSNATEESFQAMETEAVEASGVTFETDSFSEYVVVLKEGSTTQKEIQVDKTPNKEKGFEIDKYITPTGVAKNGNESYVVTLEQAYYSNDIAKPTPLPDPVDVIVVFDQSASMSGRVGAALQGLNTFYEALAEGNSLRRSKWNSGLYDIVDENHDYVDDKTGEKLSDHLISMRGVIGYTYKVYTKWTGNIALETQDQIDVLNHESRCSEQYMQPYGPAPEGYGVMDMTRTDLAISRATTLIGKGRDAYTTIVLATDGEPYGNGPEGALYYDTATNTQSGLMMTYDNTNTVLSTARSLKDKGVTLYGIFMYTRSEALPAVEAGLTSKDIHAIGNDDKYLGIKFLSLFSSDYPKNGQMGGGGTFDGSFTSGNGKFGQYVKYPQQAAEIAQAFNDTGRDITLKEGGRHGYFSATSYVYDEISYPFTYDTANAIKVYQVPRIATAKGVFKWGEKIDITKTLIASIDQSRYLTVKGYNYEDNAVTSINKNSGKTGFVETYPTKPGEYGYKLVVEFGIMSNENFGGNNIETNNSDTSGFYPSRPTGGYVDGKWVDADPEWEENKTLNPQGHDYVELYPVPHVDLNINYKIVSDNMTIYAPQTAKIQNIVTNAEQQIFFTDKGYSEAKNKAETKKQIAETLEKEYMDKAKEMSRAETEAERTALMEDVKTAQLKYDAAVQEWQAAQKEFDSVQSFIPNGDKNAYVDITYTLKDPDGQTIGTLNIPHGTKYIQDEQGNSNINWAFKDGKDAVLTKSGKYTISATVTPVTTSRKESHTGSSANGSQKPKTITSNPEVYIYILQITAKDTRLEKGQAVDFFTGANNIQMMTKDDKHIIDMKWVCTDGKTPSKSENEPGITKIASVGGAIMGDISVPNAKDYVKDINGTLTVNAAEGQYVPVAVTAYRTAGNINKDASATEANDLKTVYLRDDDKLYNGMSSVKWVHQCAIIDNCDKFEFTQAQKLNKNGTIPGVQNNVRFLVHVIKNPAPDIHKKTSTPTITKGEDIKWSISLANNDIKTNPEKYASAFSMVDALPWNKDGRYDDFMGRYSGSKFSGALKFKTIEVDATSIPDALSTVKMYWTADTKARSDEKLQVEQASWTEVSGTTSGKKISYTVPDTAIAIKMDATLPFSQTGQLVVNMTANMKTASQQQYDDVYINQARVLNEFAMIDSEPVRTQVLQLFLDGVIWIDTNGNGIRENLEPRVKGINVGLYTTHNKSGLGGSHTINIGGTQYDRAYDANNDMIGLYSTREDGSYRFDNLKAGNYIVVAEGIDGLYVVTKKNVGSDKAIDSDAETTLPKSETAWIKGLKVAGTSMKNYDIGLIEQRGKITVNKTLDEIHYLSIMTPEQRAEYTVTFTFELTNNSTKQKYIRSIMLNSDNHLQASDLFDDLPFGTYTLKETHVGNYANERITVNDNAATINATQHTVTIPINAAHNEYVVTFNNKKTEPDFHGDQRTIINPIPMHIPIKLELKYVGANPVSSDRLTSYTFKESDFNDIILYGTGIVEESEFL